MLHIARQLYLVFLISLPVDCPEPKGWEEEKSRQELSVFLKKMELDDWGDRGVSIRYEKNEETGYFIQKTDWRSIRQSYQERLPSLYWASLLPPREKVVEGLAFAEKRRQYIASRYFVDGSHNWTKLDQQLEEQDRVVELYKSALVTSSSYCPSVPKRRALEKVMEVTGTSMTLPLPVVLSHFKHRD